MKAARDPSHCEEVIRFSLSSSLREFLVQIAKAYQAQGRAIRPRHFRALHNPWAAADSIIDPWSVLEACHDQAILAALKVSLGEDIILFDSEIAPAPWDASSEEAYREYDIGRFPVQPTDGATVCLSIGDSGTTTIRTNDSIHKCYEGLVIRAKTDFALESCHASAVLLIRYFSGSSSYIRDPVNPAQQRLSEISPLTNMTRAPLWQVGGEDRAGNDFASGFSVQPAHWL